MRDYTWPSVYFAYLFFALSALLTGYFLVRSWKDGYWGKNGEDPKYQVFEDFREGVEHGIERTKN